MKIPAHQRPHPHLACVLAARASARSPWRPASPPPTSLTRCFHQQPPGALLHRAAQFEPRRAGHHQRPARPASEDIAGRERAHKEGKLDSMTRTTSGTPASIVADTLWSGFGRRHSVWWRPAPAGLRSPRAGWVLRLTAARFTDRFEQLYGRRRHRRNHAGRRRHRHVASTGAATGLSDIIFHAAGPFGDRPFLPVGHPARQNNQPATVRGLGCSSRRRTANIQRRDVQHPGVPDSTPRGSDRMLASKPDPRPANDPRRCRRSGCPSGDRGGV